jgi:hypothetical protein
MRLAEFRADNFKVFSRMTEPNRNANVNSLNYIQFLATASKTNIETWDINALFCERGNTLMQDKAEINKVFFTEKGRRDKEPNGIQVLSDEVIESLDRAIGVLANNEANRYMRDIENHKDRMLSNLRAAESAREHLLRAQDLYQEAKNRNAQTFSPQLKQILADGFWKFEGIEGDTIVLTTVNRVTMRECNPAANIDYSVDLGNYALWLRPSVGRAKVFPWIDSFRVDQTFYHPYVYTSGDICFGSASEQASLMLAGGRYFELSSLVASLLITYTPSSTPYLTLGAFKRQAESPRNQRAELESITGWSFASSFNAFVDRRINELAIGAVSEEDETEEEDDSHTMGQLLEQPSSGTFSGALRGVTLPHPF